ncbi:MAG: hypothetical protein AAB909_02500 [Patescibacteria group bacterium]
MTVLKIKTTSSDQLKEISVKPTFLETLKSLFATIGNFVAVGGEFV